MRPRVLSLHSVPNELGRYVAHEVRALVRSRHIEWKRVQVRHTERGLLEADFAVWEHRNAPS